MMFPHPPPPTPWPPETISSDKDREQLERAPNDLIENLTKEDQWVKDFVKHLNYTIADVVRKK
jgi:hypothetical protein